MTDVMEILAAAKRDVSDEPVPAVDDVWRKLDPGTRAPRASQRVRLVRVIASTPQRASRRWATAALAVVAVAVAALVVWLPATQTTSAAQPLRIFVSHQNALAARANAKKLVPAYPALRRTVALTAHLAGNVTLGFPSIVAANFTTKNTPLVQFGVDPDLATFLSTIGVNAQAWILPAAQGVCLTILGGTGASPSGGTECVTVADAASGTLATTDTSPATGTWLIGYAPAPNTTVTVTEATGAAISVPVTNGVWAISGSAATNAQSLSDLSSDGAPQTTSLGYLVG